MSWSLKITNGDFSFGGQGMNSVTGGQKLVQDLGCCLLEPMGTDPMHPTFGSTIDGGVGPNGSAESSLIGGGNDSIASASTLVNTEIRRICADYQQQQVARNNADVATYGASTLSVGEALLSVDNIQITQVETAMAVSVSLTTGSGTVQVSTMVGS